jgi:hypothetical protein
MRAILPIHVLRSHRALVSGLLLVTLLIGDRSPAWAQNKRACVCRPELTGVSGEGSDPMVRLHVFNMARVPSAVLADAEVEASEVYRAASVTLVWTDGLAERDSNGVTSSDSGVDVIVIVVRGEAERRLIVDGHLGNSILGFAPTKRGCFCSRHAFIFFERVMAYQHGNPGLLGRVLAHEVGHLLLSSDSHSRTGIMRATINTELSVRPRFTEDEVKVLRRGLGRVQANQVVAEANP